MADLRGQIENLPGYGPSNSVSRRVAADIAGEADATIADLRAQLDKATKQIMDLTEIADRCVELGCTWEGAGKPCYEEDPGGWKEWCLACKAKAALKEEG